MEQTNLTPWQQSLLKGPELTWKNIFHRLLMGGIVGLLLFGFYSEFQEQLPSYLSGWLMLAAILLIIWEWIANVVFSALQIMLFFARLALSAEKEALEKGYSDNEIEIEFKAETEKIQLTMREFVIKLTTKTRILKCLTLNFYTVADCILDWGLFSLMLLANHPILAFFQGSAVLLRYWQIGRAHV